MCAQSVSRRAWLRQLGLGAGALTAARVFGDIPALAQGPAPTARSPIAVTTRGRVRGYVDQGISVFKGIQYGSDTSVRRFQLAVLGAGVAWAAWLVGAADGGVMAWLWVGGAFVLVALPLMALAQVQIGSAFAVAPKAKALVTHGLCAKIPHPLYVFLDVALLGVVIALRQPWLVAIHAWAARREARVLERAFGDAYRQYRAKAWW